jgi:capsular exopolysaccharide synthesis family protein
VWQPPAEALRPGRDVAFAVLLPRAAATQLNDRLDVQMPPRGSFMAVNYAHTDPERAAAVVNRIADQFVAVSAELKRVRLVEVRNILETQLEIARRNLEESEYELNNFLVQTITLPAQPATPVNPGTQETRTDVLSGFYDLKIDRDNVERDRLAIERSIADGAALSIDALSSIASVQQSPELSQALTELATKRAEMRSLLVVYTTEHRQVQRAAEDVRNLETQVIPQLARNLMVELDARMASMDGRINSTSAELREIPPRAIDEARYLRNKVIAENLYNLLRQRYENARLATETTTPDVSILSRATPAQFPSTDRRLLLLAVAIMGGLGAGVALAIVLELLDKRVRYPEQISNGMRLAILGAIPDLATRRLGFGSAPDRTELLEALRSIRLNMAHAHGAAGPVMITILSPGSGDGKTFLCSNVASNFAELGLRVLVVDGDTRRGTLHRVLEVERKPGLTDYLNRSATIEGVIRTTAVPGLDIIPCGTRAASAPELLSSPRMGDLLAEFRSRYDVVLVDSPPLGAGIDPLVLATATGNVVLVLRTGKTDRTVAEAKLAILDRLPVRVLGAVMNGISTDVAFRYYSYLPGYEIGEEELEGPERLLQPK